LSVSSKFGNKKKWGGGGVLKLGSRKGKGINKRRKGALQKKRRAFSNKTVGKRRARMWEE